MPAGRPSKYKKKYCEDIVAYMSEGNSIVQFAAHIGVCRDTVNEWTREYPEFSDALRMAMTKCEAHWERIMQAKTVRKMPGNDALLMFWMKNRFKWSEKVDQNIKSEETITFSTQIGDDGSINRTDE